MKHTKLTFFVSCCALMNFPIHNALALPLVDGSFNTVEWAGYYTDTNGVVGPGVGGQAYDAERLGLYFNSSNVYFGLQTGFDLANGRNFGNVKFRPGDIAIDVNGDVSFYEYALRFKITGASVAYTLVDMTKPGAQWNAPYYAQHAAASPFNATYAEATDAVGYFNGVYGNFAPGQRIADSNINADPATLFSNVIEGSFNLAMLELYTGGPLTMHWTMECGNDIINQTSEQAPVPEPATMLLFGAGLFGFANLARKKIKK